MSATTNHSVRLQQYLGPEGYPVPGQTTRFDSSSTIDVDNVPLNGGFLLKSLVLAIDPYLRNRMLDPRYPNFWPSFKLDKAIENFGVGVVIRSDNNNYQKGDYLYGILSFEEYAVRNDSDNLIPFTKLQHNPSIPWSLYVGILGLPGQTAYFGWKAYIEPLLQDCSERRVIFVSAAAGTVGSTVVQLAKRANLKVIGCASSDKKVDFIKSIGADVAFNYKHDNIKEVLKKEGPIHYYWDNVCGETLEVALDNMTKDGIVVCAGAISGFNVKPYGIKTFHQVFTNSLKIYGLLYTDHLHLIPTFFQEVMPLVINGDIKYLEKAVSLSEFERHFVEGQKGDNVGKSVVVFPAA